MGLGWGVAQALFKAPSLLLGEANTLSGEAHSEDGVSHKCKLSMDPETSSLLVVVLSNLNNYQTSTTFKILR